MVEEYFFELSRAIAEISTQQIVDVAETIRNAWDADNCIFLFGNGGSASSSSHIANDLSKLAPDSDMPRLRAIALTDSVPLITAWANDTNYNDIFSEQLLSLIRPGDVAIGITTSGGSKNVLNAFKVAKSHGAISICLTGGMEYSLPPEVNLTVRVPSTKITIVEDLHLAIGHAIVTTIREMKLFAA